MAKEGFWRAHLLRLHRVCEIVLSENSCKSVSEHGLVVYALSIPLPKSPKHTERLSRLGERPKFGMGCEHTVSIGLGDMAGSNLEG